MMDGYVLEIRTSSSSPEVATGGSGAGANETVDRRWNNNNNNNRNTSRDGSRRGTRRRKNSGNVLDKYVKFTIKREGNGNGGGGGGGDDVEADEDGEVYSSSTGDGLLLSVLRCICIFVAVYVIWNVLRRVDIVKCVDMRGISEEVIAVGYLVISVFCVNELYWRINYEVEESLLIIPGVGVQCETLMVKASVLVIFQRCLRQISCLLGMKGRTSRGLYAATCCKEVVQRVLVPMEAVEDIVINEGFVGTSVVFYLCVVVRDAKSKGLRLECVFPVVRPRRAVLERVWRQSRPYLRRR
jgi:hypothetical protein